jgi:hypothetical protein
VVAGGRRRRGKRRKGERKERKERKGKRKEGKKGRRKEKEHRKRKGKEIGEKFGKLGKLLGKLGGRVLRGFPISGVGMIFGTVVMARRTGRRDRGVRGIHGTVADHGAREACVGAGPSAGGAGGIRGTRAEGERGAVSWVLRGDN